MVYKYYFSYTYCLKCNFFVWLIFFEKVANYTAGGVTCRIFYVDTAAGLTHAVYSVDEPDGWVHDVSRFLRCTIKADREYQKLQKIFYYYQMCVILKIYYREKRGVFVCNK